MQTKARDQQLKSRWEELLTRLTDQFSETEEIEIEGILYPFGYYAFDFYDDQGWPHFKLVEELPVLKPGEQTVLMKEAIVDYFLEKDLIQ